MTEESQMEKWINEFNAAHPAKSPPPRVGGVQVQILRAGPYSDFNVPGRPGKVGAQHLNEGEMAEFPRPYAESLVAAGLAVEVMPESEPELEAAQELDATDAAHTLALANGLDLRSIEGTGKDGRILVSDVRAALEGSE